MALITQDELIGIENSHHSYFVNSKLQGICPHCGTPTTFQRLASWPTGHQGIYNAMRSNDGLRETSFHFLLCEKHNCQKPSFFELKTVCEIVGGGRNYSATARMLPAYIDMGIIDELKTTFAEYGDRLNSVIDVINEAHKCEKSESIRGAGAMYRLAVECILDIYALDRLPQKERDEYLNIQMVGNKIKFINDKLGLSENKLVKAAQAIKSFGNDSTHPDKKFFNLVGEELEKIKSFFGIFVRTVANHLQLDKI